MVSIEAIMWVLWLVAIGLAGIALLLGDGVINAKDSGVRTRSRIIVPMWLVAGACAVAALGTAGVAALSAVQGWS